MSAAKRNRSRSPVDPMFVRCVKEEIAAGETVTIVCSPCQVREFRKLLTDDELDHVEFKDIA